MEDIGDTAAESPEKVDLQTAYRGSNLAALAEIWTSSRVYALKRGHSSADKVFGVYCEGQHRRGCRARYMVHMPPDVVPN